MRLLSARLILALAVAPGIAPALLAQPATDARTAAVPAWVGAARSQIGVTRHYDPAYVELTYPGGDVATDRGVCTDVIVRALRGSGLDLQQAIHQDMRGNFAAYPQQWGLKKPNRSIDHRRVPNQMRWFQRQGWSLPISAATSDYRAGDIVAWKLTGSGLLHIGIVSDRRTRAGVPLILHNIGRGTQEEDLLFAHAIIGHYRPPASL
ncbi:DUF1287 domain-containing protein [Pseudoxanthomonas wuyuanensis]|uniref:DUF1287 domain-containing protein n=1 Tax=Pseudoxanthomonas wuyuanensis TaxID=1073196 RepID=A0A286D7T5_9GAMM|nr:DUF1287 domain-containing protein [Pseudoxanthomonas wuyuanensis]SOD54693.1 hypothetical protein SAMN06296416_104305 [Pseudoxanthomonas wuyuanensis]